MWGHASLAARLILASFCCAVSFKEVQQSRWPPWWVDGKEESSIKNWVRLKGFMTPTSCVCVCVCVCVCACVCGGAGGIYFTTNSTIQLKLGREREKRKEKKSSLGNNSKPWDFFQESKIPNCSISVLFYSKQISFSRFIIRKDCFY